LDIKNLCGIGTDNTSVVMVGINNGVHVKLKEYISHVYAIRCNYQYQLQQLKLYQEI